MAAALAGQLVRIVLAWSLVGVVLWGAWSVLTLAADGLAVRMAERIAGQMRR